MTRRWLLTLLVPACGFSAPDATTTDDPTDVPTDVSDGDVGDVTDGDGDDVPAVDAAIDATAPDAPPPPDPVTTDHAVLADTYIDARAATTNFGTRPVILFDGPPDTAYALARFDLASIPSSAQIQAVELHVTTADDAGNAGAVHAVLESWSETQATLAQREAGAGWSGPGGRPARSAMPIGEVPASVTDTAYTIVLDPATVAGWLANPSSNHGVVFVMGGNDGVYLRSRESGAPSMHPFLRIRYLP